MKVFLITMYLGVVLFCSCTKNHIIPIEEGGSAPKKITNIEVENLPGAAKISYTLPKDPNLLYVLARLTQPNGKVREFKASYYTNSLLVDGFANTDKQELSIFSVSKGEILSEPTQVTVEPLLPPYLATFQSLQLSEDFGGVNLVFENKVEADLGIFLCFDDEYGNFEAQDSYYTSIKEGNYTFRGLPSEDKVFGVYIKDRWNNISDTLKVKLTPLFEKMFDKSRFKEVFLPGDAKEYLTAGTEWNIAKRFMWNNDWSSDFDEPYGTYLNFTTNALASTIPSHSTFDMGVSGRISRIRINHYSRFEGNALRKYEIWGATQPAADGSWEGWTKLAEYEQKKPSGLPPGEYSAADREVWLQGDNININPNAPSVRYVRIRCLENWVGTTNLSLAEITLWGDDRL